jgi:hypothetical protein
MGVDARTLGLAWLVESVEQQVFRCGLGGLGFLFG